MNLKLSTTKKWPLVVVLGSFFFIHSFCSFQAQAQRGPTTELVPWLWEQKYKLDAALDLLRKYGENSYAKKQNGSKYDKYAICPREEGDYYYAAGCMREDIRIIRKRLSPSLWKYSNHLADPLVELEKCEVNKSFLVSCVTDRASELMGKVEWVLSRQVQSGLAVLAHSYQLKNPNDPINPVWLEAYENAPYLKPSQMTPETRAKVDPVLKTLFASIYDKNDKLSDKVDDFSKVLKNIDVKQLAAITQELKSLDLKSIAAFKEQNQQQPLQVQAPTQTAANGNQTLDSSGKTQVLLSAVEEMNKRLALMEKQMSTSIVAINQTSKRLTDVEKNLKKVDNDNALRQNYKSRISKPQIEPVKPTSPTIEEEAKKVSAPFLPSQNNNNPSQQKLENPIKPGPEGEKKDQQDL